jgi:serine protease Do
MDQIVRTGKVTRGFMGVLLQDVTPEIAEAMKLGQTRGALVSDVEPGSPAARADFEPGDVIVEADGKPIADRRALQLFIASMHPGSALSMRVQRDGSIRSVTLTLIEAQQAKPAPEDQGTSAPPENTPSRIGIRTDDLTPQIREEYKIPTTTKGVVVAEVQEGSAADEAGLLPGDVIQEVNRKSIENKTEFRSEVGKLGSQALLLRVNREGHGLFVAIK